MYQTESDTNNLKNAQWLYKTPSENTIKNLAFIQELGYFETDSTHYTKRNGLQSFLLLFTVSGIGELQYQGKNYLLDKNSLIFIDCMNLHYYYTQDNWKYYFIHFNGPNIAYYYDIFAKNNNLLIHSHDDVILDYIKLLINNDNSLRSDNEFLIAKSLTDILTRIIVEKENIRFSLIPDVLNQAKIYLNHQYAEKLTLNSLSRKFNVSESYLSKGFKKYFNETPMDYLNKTRIDKSKYLLKKTEMNLDEIAEILGISSAPHFIKLFKKYLHTTPKKYRILWK